MNGHCTNCDVLRAEIVELNRRYGQMFPKGALGLLTEKTVLSPNQSRLVLALFYGDDWVGTWDLVDRLDTTADILKTNISRIRWKLGREIIETRPRVGYRLSDVGRRKLEKVLNAH